MSQTVILDTGVIGLITNPKQSTQSESCATWLQYHLIAGTTVIIPEIADYEVRRELLRANKEKGLKRLDELIKYLEYLPICTLAMRQAAQVWAQARQQGQPTADDKNIDADMILIAQAKVLLNYNTVIATTNVRHLSRFVSASRWPDIIPES